MRVSFYLLALENGMTEMDSILSMQIDADVFMLGTMQEIY